MTTITAAAAVTPTTSTATSSAATSKANDQLGKDTFLKLLVAQLKYQNPMSPTDPTAFMAQTAQFSMVEKLEQMATESTDLLAAERSRAATGLLGNQVTWTDATSGKDVSGVVSSIRLGADGPTLVVGDKEVPYASVTSVTTAPVPTSSPTA